ncbi:MAG: DUF4142 domain-containing protein [Gammaproteobacteria bacterium]|nr:DUF4142 domain-containing protein [Gammaproteobacteria bacterium]
MKVRMLILYTLIASGSTPGTHVLAADTPIEEDRNKTYVGQGNAQIPMTDHTFVARAALGGNAEIEASKLALKVSENQKLHKFAEMMIKDHQTANMELKNIASKINIGVPTSPDTVHQKALKKMQSMEGIAFDEAYVKMMQQDHDMTVDLFEKAAADPQLTNELRVFATEKLSILLLHQRHAHSLGTIEISDTPRAKH